MGRGCRMMPGGMRPGSHMRQMRGGCARDTRREDVQALGYPATRMLRMRSWAGRVLHGGGVPDDGRLLWAVQMMVVSCGRPR